MNTDVSVTLADFLARPEREDDQCEELIDGELVVSPSAKVWHADIVRRLLLSLAALERRDYVLANDFACILGKLSMPAPDLAVVRVERWNNAVKNDGWLEGSPDLVIEVASPSNRMLQRKAALYLEHGAEQVWTVYRNSKTVEVMTFRGSVKVRTADSLEFCGVRVPVSSLFPDS